MTSAPIHPIDAEHCDIVLRDNRDARFIISIAISAVTLILLSFAAGCLCADLLPAAPGLRCATFSPLAER